MKVMLGEFVELEPYERLVFRFGWEPTDGAPVVAPASTLVVITLTPDGDDTILDVRQTGIPLSETERQRIGWWRFVERLAEAAEGA
jgi:uncharacterized protein YndB with AHSA1/START domain